MKECNGAQIVQLVSFKKKLSYVVSVDGFVVQ